MATEKDRFGDKLRESEKAREDLYFAKRDKELIDKLKSEKEKAFQDELAAAAAMRCPRCGHGLDERVENGVRIDECPNCGGLWLDKGEFEALAEREESSWLGRLFKSRKSPAD
jgi:hypothetical protein